MKRSRGVLPDVERLTHFYHKVACESGILVMNECFGESYTLEHVFQVKFGAPSAVIVSLHGKSIMALCNATAGRSSTTCTIGVRGGKGREFGLGTQLDGEKIDSVPHRST